MKTAPRTSNKIDYKNDPRFSFIYTSGLTGVVFTYIEGDKVIKHEANDAFLRMIGYSKEEVESEPSFLMNITTPAFKGISKAALGSLQTQSDFNNYEKEYIHKNGSIVHVIGSTKKIDDHAIVAFISDITKQRRAEERLKATESLFKSFASSGIVGINFWNTEGKMWGVNQAYTDIHGYTEEDVTSPSFEWSQIPVKGEEHKFMNGLQKVLNGETVKPYATQVKHKDGKVIDILVGYALIEGSSSEGICVTLDISREKKMERALKESEERLQKSEERFKNMVEQSPTMTFIGTMNAEVSYVNRALVDFTGMQQEQFKGDSWLQSIHPDDAEEIFSGWKKAVEAKEDYSVSFRMIHSTGEYRNIEAYSKPMHYSNEVQGYVGVLVDVTDQLNAELASKEILRKKDEFLSIASHELKTPLTSLKASTQLLGELLKDKEYDLLPTYLAKADKQLDKLVQLINELLDVSKIDAGKMDLHYEEFDAHELIETAKEYLLASNKKFSVDITGKLIRVVADKGRLEQVIYNFLSNAVKYSAPASKVEIEMRVEENSLLFSVRDNGMGIPEEKLPHIFERFYRVDESSRKATGLGLGLYISSEIIRKHNGTISVESKPEKGSVFSFTIPFTSDIKS